MKQFIYALVAVLVIAVGFNLFVPAVNSTNDLPQLTIDQVFEQPKDDYAVYFYTEDCGICKDFEPTIIHAKTKDSLPIYVVDMRESENEVAWYDWENHHNQYDKVIGRVENGKEILNEGESHDDYPAEEGFEIVTKGNEIVAVNNKAVNNKKPTTFEELEISGTPTLIRVQEGKVIEYGEGIDQSTVILDNMRP